MTVHSQHEQAVADSPREVALIGDALSLFAGGDLDVVSVVEIAEAGIAAFLTDASAEVGFPLSFDDRAAPPAVTVLLNGEIASDALPHLLLAKGASVGAAEKPAADEVQLAMWGPIMAPLVAEYDARCVANRLPHVDADEQDPEALTPDQANWIDDFRERWTAAQREDDAANPDVGAVRKAVEAVFETSALARYVAPFPIPARAEDEDWTPGERAGFAAFANNRPLALADNVGFSPDLKPDDWRRGWWRAYARVYGQGIKARVLNEGEIDNPYPQFSTAGEAWAEGADDASAL